MNDECKKHAAWFLTGMTLINGFSEAPRIAHPLLHGPTMGDAVNAPSTGYRLADLSVAPLSLTSQTTRY